MPSLLQEARAGACEVVANGVNFFWRKAHLQGEKPTMPALAHANGVGRKTTFSKIGVLGFWMTSKQPGLCFTLWALRLL